MALPTISADNGMVRFTALPHFRLALRLVPMKRYIASKISEYIMADGVRNYDTARRVLGLLMFIGWFFVVLGIIAAVAGAVIGMGLQASPEGPISSFAGVPGVAAAIPGLLLALVGLFSVASNQIGQAILDTSVATQRTALFMRGGGQVLQPQVSERLEPPLRNG